MSREGASFDQSYKDRRIAVSGWINSVERLNDNGYVVKFGGAKLSSAAKDNVLAVFYDYSRTGPPDSMKPGVFIKLSGVYAGQHPFPLEDCAFTMFGCSLTEVASEDQRP